MIVDQGFNRARACFGDLQRGDKQQYAEDSQGDMAPMGTQMGE
jgi:hypothetical protein